MPSTLAPGYGRSGQVELVALRHAHVDQATRALGFRLRLFLFFSFFLFGFWVLVLCFGFCFLCIFCSFRLVLLLASDFAFGLELGWVELAGSKWIVSKSE